MLACPRAQDVVYSCRHEDALRSASRAGKTAEDTMDIGSIAEAVAEVQAAIKAAEAESTSVAPASLPEAPSEPADSGAQAPSVVSIMVEKIKIQSGAAQLQDEQLELVQQKQVEAMRLVESNCRFVELPSSEKKVLEALQASAAGKAKPAEGNFVGIFMDQGLWGEPVTAPHLRLNAVNIPMVKARVD